MEHFIVFINDTIRHGIKKMDKNGKGIVVCTDKNQSVTGIITNGDFRRAILNGIDLNNEIYSIAKTDFLFLLNNHSTDDITTLFNEKRIDQIPILKNQKLVDIIFRKNGIKKGNSILSKFSEPLDIVIMAGGLGTRLLPLTNIIPKPLIPIGKKTILETIIDQYSNNCKNDFYISVNYKADIIKSYLEKNENDYNLIYLDEEKPLGTIGVLYKLKNKIKNTIMLTNCDSIIYEKISKVYEYHKLNKNKITIIGALRHYPISYGVCEIDKKGNLTKLDEKPEIDFLVNSGTYLIEPEMLNLIPKNSRFDATDLINKAILDKFKIGVYPISSEKWVDVGQFKEYNQLLKKLC